MVKFFKEGKEMRFFKPKFRKQNNDGNRVGYPSYWAQAQFPSLTQRGLTIVDQNVDFSLPNFDHS